MQIRTFVLGELQTNCYLLTDPVTKEALIIDPVAEADFLSEEIQRSGLILTAILATHGHFDHVLAGWELQLNFSVPFFLHRADLPLLKRMATTPPPGKVTDLSKSKRVKFGQSFSGEVIPTPGHTPGSVCFYFPQEKVVFTGDTLFADGVGRTDLPYSSQNALQRSLQQLRRLPKETSGYPGHGDSFLF